MLLPYYTAPYATTLSAKSPPSLTLVEINATTKDKNMR